MIKYMYKINTFKLNWKSHTNLVVAEVGLSRFGCCNWLKSLPWWWRCLCGCWERECRCMRSHDLAVWNHSIDQYEAPLRERDEFEHFSSQFNHKINLSSSRTFLINKRAIMFVFCVCVFGCSVFLKSLSSGSKTLQTSCFSQHEVWKSALFFTLKFLCCFWSIPVGYPSHISR